MHTLTVDRGNSSAKFAVFDAEGSIINTFRLAPPFDERLPEFRLYIEGYEISRVAYVSVVHDLEELSLEKMILSGLPGMVDFFKFNHSWPLPFRVNYLPPHSLGLDRLVAMAGAYTLFENTPDKPREVLVVDAGSAITYDLLSLGSPEFVGGNIAPGIRARLLGLSAVAPGLPSVEITYQPDGTPVFGNDTLMAIRCGVVQGVVGEILYYAGNAPVVITGGDAEVLTPLLPPGRCLFEPNLIHLGLYSLC